MSDHKVEIRPREDDTCALVHLEVSGAGIPQFQPGILIPSKGPTCPSPSWQADNLHRMLARVFAAGVAQGKLEVRQALGLN